jgi:microcystin degradation protein MlrC
MEEFLMGEQRKKRVLVCELHQESNTFNPIVAGYERFLGNEHVEGIEAYQEIKLQPIAPHGMFDAIEEAGGEIIPTIFLNADSGGRVDDAVLQTLIDRVSYYIGIV